MVVLVQQVEGSLADPAFQFPVPLPFSPPDGPGGVLGVVKTMVHGLAHGKAGAGGVLVDPVPFRVGADHLQVDLSDRAIHLDPVFARCLVVADDAKVQVAQARDQVFLLPLGHQGDQMGRAPAQPVPEGPADRIEIGAESFQRRGVHRLSPRVSRRPPGPTGRWRP